MAPFHHGRAGAARPPAAAALWGDGFAGDGLGDLCAVRDWSVCSPDEYILLFPRLIPRAGDVPPVLRAHLESCVTARAWRLGRLEGGSAGPRLRSRLPDPDSGADRHRDWFADDDAVTCLLRRIGLLRTTPERVEAEREMLAFLDGLLAEVQAHRVPGWDESAEALLAFGAGIHPAYLWPQAAVSAARGIAAGWLGLLDRGRTALMPAVVAEYLLDALGASVDRRDSQLARLAGSAADLDVLRRAARRRWSGLDAKVRRVVRPERVIHPFGRAGPMGPAHRPAHRPAPGHVPGTCTESGRPDGGPPEAVGARAPDAASPARVFAGRGRSVQAAEAGA